MQTILLVIGKTKDDALNKFILDYKKRINKYQKFEIKTISDIKNKGKINSSLLKQKESKKIICNLMEKDYLILLDEKGKQMNTKEFSIFIQKRRIESHKRIIFLIGGIYGVSENIKTRANEIRALSKMTFTHQMIRLIFVEQLFRINKIINNESYHH